jgi:hypothetical protein
MPDARQRAQDGATHFAQWNARVSVVALENRATRPPRASLGPARPDARFDPRNDRDGDAPGLVPARGAH